MLAYKYLVRHMPIPREIEKNLFNLSKEQWEIERERIVNKSLQFYNDRVDKNDQLKKIISEKLTKKTLEPNAQHLNESTIQAFIEKKDYYVQKRKEEINFFLSKSADALNPNTKQKLLCELKMLGLIELYNKTRDTIIKGIEKSQLQPRIYNK